MSSLNELIERTEQMVRNRSKSFVKALFQPQYPAVIRLCAAPDAQEQITDLLRSGMHRYWSDLADSVGILPVSGADCTDSTAAAAELSVEIRKLLRTKQIFRNLAVILYFDIVQTGQFASLDAFEAYYQQYLDYQYDENHSISRMMFVIHDAPVEDPDQRKTAGEILKFLRDAGTESQNVVVLSSQLSGGAEIEADDPARYAAIATLISLTDIESQPNFYAKLFSVERPAVMTVGRVYHEKPFRLIAIYTVNALISNIAAHFSDANAVSVTTDDLKKTFCPQTRFELIEQYYDAAKKELPREDCMQYLPYQDTAKTYPAGINAFWQAFFEENFVSRMQEKADEQYELLRSQFVDRLMQTFTHQQLAYLNQHPDVTDPFWSGMQTDQIVLGAPDYSRAAAAVRSLYTDRVITRLKDDIHKILESANSVSNLLEQFQSRMHDIVFSASANDQTAESVSRYYDTAVVRQYVGQHWNQIRMDFSALQNQSENTREGLLALLEKYAEEIIRSGEIYNASFEDELQARMANDGLNDQQMQNNRAVTTVSDYVMGTAVRQTFLPDLNPEKLLEVYLIPENAKYLHIVRQRLQETDAVQTIPADQYIERIALFRV